jgi:hypothetical protein
MGHLSARAAFFGSGEDCEICHNGNGFVMRKNRPEDSVLTPLAVEGFVQYAD